MGQCTSNGQLHFDARVCLFRPANIYDASIATTAAAAKSVKGNFILITRYCKSKPFGCWMLHQSQPIKPANTIYSTHFKYSAPLFRLFWGFTQGTFYVSQNGTHGLVPPPVGQTQSLLQILYRTLYDVTPSPTPPPLTTTKGMRLARRLSVASKASGRPPPGILSMRSVLTRRLSVASKAPGRLQRPPPLLH